MSWSMTCVLPWPQLDIDRVVTALDEALRQCAVKWPAYAKAVRDPPDSTSSRFSVHVMFPAELVEAPGWELERPSATPDDGTYPCTFDHYLIDPDPAHDYPGECGLTLASNRSANREAWITASTVLEQATALLGGELRDF